MLLKDDWAAGNSFTHTDANAVAAKVNTILVPEDFGAVGDGTTDDTGALTDMFDSATENGGACILIPYGKVYACTAVDIRSNTYVFGGGTLKCLTDGGQAVGGGGIPGAFMLFHGIQNVTWIGPTLDINEKLNVNGFDIGVPDFDTESPAVEDIYVVAKVKGSRIAVTDPPGIPYSEDTSNRLFAGGGKGMALGFRVRNCYANIRFDDCDIACAVESTETNDHPVENVLLDIQAVNSHRTALFLAGGLDGVAGSLDSGSFLHARWPGVKVRLRAYGGQDASVTNPVTGVVGANYEHVGVVTMNYASGVDLEVTAAAEERCTLVRGMANASNIRVTNALMDELQDGWDTRPLETLDPGLTFMPDNVFKANIHAATHHGVLVRSHRTSGNRTLVKTSIDVNAWCVNGVGLPTQVDGTTDEFGSSVKYRFCDQRTNPIREVIADSSYSVRPGWATGAHFNSLDVAALTVDSVPTITSGTGTPEGSVTAPVGSLYLRTDGGASTTLYVKQSGTGDTGWAAK